MSLDRSFTIGIGRDGGGGRPASGELAAPAALRRRFRRQQRPQACESVGGGQPAGHQRADRVAERVAIEVALGGQIVEEGWAALLQGRKDVAACPP